MSEPPPDVGWWKATDRHWYPPDVAPGWLLPPRAPNKWRLWAILAAIAAVLVVLAAIPISSGGGSPSDPGVVAAGACIDVAGAGQQVAAGTRSIASFRSVVTHAEGTARRAADENSRYAPALQVIVEIRDDIDSGRSFAGPLAYLESQCGLARRGQ